MHSTIDCNIYVAIALFLKSVPQYAKCVLSLRCDFVARRNSRNKRNKISTQDDTEEKEVVYLRKRPRSNGTVALYLDICRDGKRTNEYLKLYLVPERTREDKQKNKETLKLAEAMRAKRVVEIQSKDFGIDVATHEDAMFLK